MSVYARIVERNPCLVGSGSEACLRTHGERRARWIGYVQGGR